MKISTVTVCRNSAKTIGHTIESFAKQSHAAKELVVIDGGSSDETLAIVSSFALPNARIVSEPDSGIYDAMNKGLRLFSGEAVGFLNSDDRYKDGMALARIDEALKESDIVHGSLDFVADHSSHRVLRQWRAGDFQKGAFRRGWMPAHPTFYIRRAVVEAVDGFDTQFRSAADYDFMLRALELQDFRVKTVDAVLIEMMTGGDSTSGPSAYLRHNLEALRARQKWLGAGWIDYALFAKPLGKLGQFLPSMRGSGA